jgi:transposase
MSETTTYVNWYEARRMRAWELSQQGWKPIRIAEALGVTPGAVSQWLAKAEALGPIALTAQKATGAPPRLTAEQLARLPDLLRQGAVAHGFVGNVWTSERVAVLIERIFHVRYAASHVRRLLKRLGWSRQKPVRRATQRDEAAIATWAEERYPELKKMPKRGPHPAICR